MLVKLRKDNIGEPKHVHSYSAAATADNNDNDDDDEDDDDSHYDDGSGGRDGFQSDRI